MLTMQQIEDRIIDLADRMEVATHDYAEACNIAAEAEHAYRKRRADVAASLIHTEPKTPANVRDVKVERHCTDELRERLQTDATRGVIRESLLTMRSTMEALRTLAATARYQTSH